jgi:hypothetical protein
MEGKVQVSHPWGKILLIIFQASLGLEKDQGDFVDDTL